MKNLKIALVSQKFAGDVLKCRQKSVEMIEKVAKDGAKLVILQELHEWAYFCQSERVENFALAENFNESLKFWGETAKKFGIVLVTSLFEKRAPGLFHNTAIVFENNGEIAGKYRKMHIPDDPNFYEKFYFTPGDTGFKVFDTAYGKVGVGICWDQWFPETARAMAVEGAEILLYPTAIGSEPILSTDSMPHWRRCMQGHSASNLVPVIAANRVGEERVEPCAENAGQSSSLVFYGSSFITDGCGEVQVSMGRQEEGFIAATFDLDQLMEDRLSWGLFRDRRPEMYGKLM